MNWLIHLHAWIFMYIMDVYACILCIYIYIYICMYMQYYMYTHIIYTCVWIYMYISSKYIWTLPRISYNKYQNPVCQPALDVPSLDSFLTGSEEAASCASPQFLAVSGKMILAVNTTKSMLDYRRVYKQQIHQFTAIKREIKYISWRRLGVRVQQKFRSFLGAQSPNGSSKKICGPVDFLGWNPLGF